MAAQRVAMQAAHHAEASEPIAMLRMAMPPNPKTFPCESGLQPADPVF